jgi:hypothetical protein
MEENDQQRDREEILGVIAGESAAFWNKDYESWASYWVQAPYIRAMGWYPHGGVSYLEGWEALSARTKAHLAEDPTPNPTASNVRRENINLRIYPDSAWVTFDQYGTDTGQPTFDMPGCSRETRILEKHDGRWKLVYVSWLLQGNA